jgi:hypothetical protein
MDGIWTAIWPPTLSIEKGRQQWEALFKTQYLSWVPKRRKQRKKSTLNVNSCGCEFICDTWIRKKEITIRSYPSFEKWPCVLVVSPRHLSTRRARSKFCCDTSLIVVKTNNRESKYSSRRSSERSSFSSALFAYCYRRRESLLSPIVGS